ncbi:MAG: metallophosphoesterase [Frankiales bacterium]|jgi:predicted MPP superfamily phosphohydrolase|nr:metallophosphoesterase [Frankiales bacterium]
MRLRTAVTLAAVAGAVGPFVEPLFPVLRRQTVPLLPTGARPLTVLHVSDLHLLPRHGRRSRWLQDLARLEPDLVVSTGDHLSAAAAVPLLASTLAALTADGTPGVFVPGNNDYYSPVRPSLLGYVVPGPPVRRGPDLPWHEAVRALETVGWTDLTSRRVQLDLHGLPVTLTGTDDAHLNRDRYARVAGPVDGFGIGVTHTPQRRVLDAFAADGHDLLLAGHTHGGQVRLPGIGPLVTNCDLDRSRARGLSRHGESWLHVSAGMGTSPYAPVRLLCRPEATLLTLL